jgi:hypothetical protein
LRRLQDAQSAKLHIEIPYLSRTSANPVEHFQQLFPIAVALWDEFFEQRLQTSRRRSKAVDCISLLASRQLEQIPLSFLE